MPTDLERKPWEQLPPVPLEEAVWQDWLVKGRARERRSNAAWRRAGLWALIVALAAVTGWWAERSQWLTG